MAVYKPTYCYPYLEPVDFKIPDGPKYFTCQVDTSNIGISGYRAKLLNENNEVVFPTDGGDGKISPISELGIPSALNGEELRFPFIQSWDNKTTSSYNAIYCKIDYYVNYYQEEELEEAADSYKIKDGAVVKADTVHLFIDNYPVYVGETFIAGGYLYEASAKGLQEISPVEGIYYIVGGESFQGKSYEYQDSSFVSSDDALWVDINGESVDIKNDGKTYKWQVTLFSGEKGKKVQSDNTKDGIEVKYVDYSGLANPEFNTFLGSGTILGSTEDRIQGPISDKIYAKQWLQLLRKGKNNTWEQVGTRTYIESYSQSVGHIYPISGDSRGFNNSNLYGDNPATHFAVYKYSNDPNSITTQNSVDQSVNFVLTSYGASHTTGSYSYEVTGSTQAEALANIKKFNEQCIADKSTPLCEISDDGDSGKYSGQSVLIWNKPSTTGNSLTGYFTISFSLVNGSNGEKIPKFVFDMAYAYRKVSSYIGKVFFVKGGSFANENIVSKAEATGEQDVASLGFPITFIQEEPLEIYPNEIDKFHGEIFKNHVENGKGTVYVSPFVGLQAGARLYVSDGTIVKALTVDTDTWTVTYEPSSPASDKVYSSTDSLKYEIRTNFKSSDETPFYAYDTPQIVPWAENALSVIDANTGSTILLEKDNEVLTVPVFSETEVRTRFVVMSGQYIQPQGVSWTSYQWYLVDSYGNIIQDTGKKYDGRIKTTFYGLDGPRPADVADGITVPNVYYAVLVVEDELGNSLALAIKLAVEISPQILPMEFSGEFDCRSHAVVLKIQDYGYPKFSQTLSSTDAVNVLTADNGVNYQINENKPEESIVAITGAGESLLAADQVIIPTAGAQLKHFFAKGTDSTTVSRKLATNTEGNIEWHTKVKLDANFCGEILKYSVDIGDGFGNTDKLNILLEMPNNFKESAHTEGSLNPNRNLVNCVVSTSNGGRTASAAGVKLFTKPSGGSKEAYYLQPSEWIDGNGDIINSNKQGLEYLDFTHPFVKQIDGQAVSYVEQKDYTNINEPINTKAERDIGECCLQVDGGSYFNKWTDLKRIQVETPAEYRVVQTSEPAVWNDTENGSPKIWTEGWSEADTTMVQVKRHAEVATKTWLIDCYMRDIDELYNRGFGLTFDDDKWILQARDPNYQLKDYIVILFKEEVSQ